MGAKAGPHPRARGTHISVQRHIIAYLSSANIKPHLPHRQTDRLSMQRSVEVYHHGTRWAKNIILSGITVWSDMGVVDIQLKRNRPIVGLESKNFLHTTSCL
jgi:hypothetical protein